MNEPTIKLIPLDMIEDNPYQTRTYYDPAGIEELAQDIQQNGLMQRPKARPTQWQGETRYQLAFGHRRLRAYQLLAEKWPDFGQIPLEIEELTDTQMDDYAWSENEARRSVSAIERAESFRRSIEMFGYTTKQLAEKRGVSSSVISNTRRLLELPEPVQDMIREGKLTERHGRELLPLQQVAKQVKPLLKLAQQAATTNMTADNLATLVQQEMVQHVEPIPDDVRDFEDWGALLPNGCLPKCQDCPFFTKHQKQDACRAKKWLGKRREARKKRLLQIASIQTGVEVNENRRPIANTTTAAIAIDGEKPCENLCLTWENYSMPFYARRCETIQESHHCDNVYYGCKQSNYECACHTKMVKNNYEASLKEEKKAANGPTDDRHARRMEMKEQAGQMAMAFKQQLTERFQAALDSMNDEARQLFEAAILRRAMAQDKSRDEIDIAGSFAGTLFYGSNMSPADVKGSIGLTHLAMGCPGAEIEIIEGHIESVNETIELAKIGQNDLQEYEYHYDLEQAWQRATALPDDEPRKAELVERVESLNQTLRGEL